MTITYRQGSKNRYADGLSRQAWVESTTGGMDKDVHLGKQGEMSGPKPNR